MDAINTILFYIVVFDAIVVLLLGAAAALVVLLDIKTSGFVGRIPHATFLLVLASLGCGALLWGAGYLFGG